MIEFATIYVLTIMALIGMYSYSAIIQAGTGDSRRGCWYRAEPPHKGLVPMVLIVEEMEYDGKIIYNIGSFGQYYFKDTKE